MRIAIDLDGVLADTMSHLCIWIGEKYGIALAKEEIIEWDYNFGPNTITSEVLRAFKNESFISSLVATKGSKNAVRDIRTEHRILIATSRPLSTQIETEKWVFKHYGAIKIVFVREKQKIDADVLVDDNLESVLLFAKIRGHSILFEQPWNQDHGYIENFVESGKIACCSEWSELPRMLRKMSRRP